MENGPPSADAANITEEDETQEQEDDCPICLMVLEDTGVGPQKVYSLLNCHHAFHEVCLDLWIAKCQSKEVASTCPSCRSPIIR